MDDKDWNPGYWTNKGVFVPYDKGWFCEENKLIHSSYKEYLNCKYCNKKEK